MTQEIEYTNVELAALAGQLADGTGFPFQKWIEFKSLLKDLKKHLKPGDEEREAQKHTPPFEVPKPNSPDSPHYEIYTRLKTKWLELKNKS